VSNCKSIVPKLPVDCIFQIRFIRAKPIGDPAGKLLELKLKSFELCPIIKKLLSVKEEGLLITIFPFPDCPVPFPLPVFALFEEDWFSPDELSCPMPKTSL